MLYLDSNIPQKTFNDSLGSETARIARKTTRANLLLIPMKKQDS